MPRWTKDLVNHVRLLHLPSTLCLNDQLKSECSLSAHLCLSLDRRGVCPSVHHLHQYRGSRRPQTATFRAQRTGSGMAFGPHPTGPIAVHHGYTKVPMEPMASRRSGAQPPHPTTATRPPPDLPTLEFTDTTLKTVKASLRISGGGPAVPRPWTSRAPLQPSTLQSVAASRWVAGHGVETGRVQGADCV